MSTDDENGRTGGAEDSPTDTPRGDEDGEESAETFEDAPQIRDYPGPWDEVVNRLIIVLLPAGVVGSAGYLFLSDSIRVTYAITGEIPASLVFRRLVVPVAYGVGAALLVLYALALMKFYGSNPFAWVVEKVRNAARDYNPEE